MLLPLATVGLALVVITILERRKRRKQAGNGGVFGDVEPSGRARTATLSSMEDPASMHTHRQLLVSLMIFLLPSVSRTICQSFRCIEFDDGDFVYLQADYAIDCTGAG